MSNRSTLAVMLFPHFLSILTIDGLHVYTCTMSKIFCKFPFSDQTIFLEGFEHCLSFLIRTTLHVLLYIRNHTTSHMHTTGLKQKYTMTSCLYRFRNASPLLSNFYIGQRREVILCRNVDIMFRKQPICQTRPTSNLC